MYIIDLTYNRPMNEVNALFDVHIAWVQKYLDNGIFIAAGSKSPRTGGVILAKSISADELNQIVLEDPYQQVADYTVVNVDISLVNEKFSKLNKI
ncbi:MULTISPECIES: YciI family protein [Acinetobacter calcoaceticus/baumannii complex]|uniref:YciI family protein n=1 Tax=Acinetobacter calcoaceticus/baumannii complex TaxID=909768 RepID=UPI000BF8FF06|nr:YciI family protein [Acinetobacter baumannii]